MTRERFHARPDRIHYVSFRDDGPAKPHVWCSVHTRYHEISEDDARRLSADPGIILDIIDPDPPLLVERVDKWVNRIAWGVAIFALAYLLAQVMTAVRGH